MKPPGLADYDRRPSSKQKCYDVVKDYFMSKCHDLLNRVNRVTDHSHYEAGAGEWDARGSGLKLAFALTRHVRSRRGAGFGLERRRTQHLQRAHGRRVVESVARALCDMFGVCVSAGFHCTHVLHARAHLPGTVRASPHLYNTTEEIDVLLEGVREIAS